MKYEGEIPENIARCKEYQDLVRKERGEGGGLPSAQVLSMNDEAHLEIADEQEVSRLTILWPVTYHS